MDPSKARNFHDYPQTNDLYLHVWDEAHNSHQSHKGAQIFAAISHLEKISLGLQAVLSPHFPNKGKDEERNGINQGTVPENVQDGPPFE